MSRDDTPTDSCQHANMKLLDFDMFPGSQGTLFRFELLSIGLCSCCTGVIFPNPERASRLAFDEIEGMVRNLHNRKYPEYADSFREGVRTCKTTAQKVMIYSY